MSTIKEVLLEHEWSWKEGNKVFCQSCGKEHKDTTKIRKHRENCKFIKTIKKLELASNCFGECCLDWNVE